MALTRYRVTQAAALALFVLLVNARAARATPISWEYDLLVHGTAISTSNTLVNVPIGTPMRVGVSFDTNTPNVCGSDPHSGTYLIGSGNSNSAFVDFLGFRYSATGGIEINAPVGNCGFGGPVITDAGVRLFPTQGSVQTDPGGTQILWLGQFGNLYLEVPPSAWLGAAFPSGLPPQMFPFGGNNFIPGSSPTLFIDATTLQAVPEPVTVALLGIPVVVAAIRRRLSV